MDAVRKLILDRVTDRKTSLSEVSLKIGRNHAYLQQFINRGVPAEIPEKIRGPLAAAIDVTEDDLRLSKKNSGVKHNVRADETFLAPLRSARKSPDDTQKVNPDAQIPGARLIGDADLPVFGTAQGGKGALILSNDAVDWVVRPDPLLRVKDGYGMIVTGDSMWPEHKDGSIALVNPHMKPRAGDTCVFRRHDEDGSSYAVIKELRRATDDTWYVAQHKPKKTFTLKRSEWQDCHVAVGNYARR